MLKSLFAKPLRVGVLLLAAIAAASCIAPEFWRKIFSTQGFMPHGHCYFWRPEVVWLHVGSDMLIGLSYVAISATLAYLVHKARREIPFHWMILGFGLFIVACGGTHFMEVWTLWQPRYWLSGDIKLLKHVTDLLDIAKLDAGKMTVHFSSVDLVKLLRGSAAYFESLAREKKIELTVVTPGPVITRADPEKLQRVFLNLLSNAFKFTPAGRPIRCALRAEPDRAVIEFEDSGPGVPGNLGDAIFERFRQGDGHSTRRFGGTG